MPVGRFRGAAVPLLVVGVLLSGCVGTPSAGSTAAAPTPSATPEPVPTATAVPEPARIVATSTELTVLDAKGATLLRAEYTDVPDEVIDELAELFGFTPIRTDVAGSGGGCALDQSFYDFRGLTLEVPGGLTSQPGSAFAVELNGTSVEGVPLETVEGQQVGVGVDDFLAAVPDAVLSADYEGLQLVGYDIIDPSVEAYERIGALAHGTSGVVESFAMPYYVAGDC